MCWSKEVSISAYLTGLAGCLALLRNNFIVEAMFFAFVLQVQLAEFFIWKNQPCGSCREPNNIKASKSALLITSLEPTVLWFAVLLFAKKKLPQYLNIIMAMYSLYSVYYISKLWNKVECIEKTVRSKPHLDWKWPEKEKSSGIYYFLYVLAFCVLSYYGFHKGAVGVSVILASFLISLFVYKDKHAVGSMWCFSGALSPWIVYFSYKLK